MIGSFVLLDIFEYSFTNEIVSYPKTNKEPTHDKIKDIIPMIKSKIIIISSFHKISTREQHQEPPHQSFSSTR